MVSLSWKAAMLINCAGFALAYYAWERVRSAAAEVGAAFLHKRRERFFGRWAAQQLAKVWPSCSMRCSVAACWPCFIRRLVATSDAKGLAASFLAWAWA